MEVEPAKLINTLRAGRPRIIARLAVVGLVGLILIVFYGLATGPPEPVVQSRGLGDWLDGVWARPAEPQDECEQAVRSLGTNAIPFLMAELEIKYSTPRRKFIEWSVKQNWVMSLRKRFHFWADPTERNHHERAKRGFRILGKAARPALPLLAGALSDPHTALDATIILAETDDSGKLYFGPEVGPLLLPMLKHPNPEIRWRSAYAVGHAQMNPQVAVPALLSLFSDPDAKVRAMAVMAVGGIYKQEAARIVPALTAAIDDTDVTVRSRALFMLGIYGKLSEAAVPRITKATNDPNKEIRDAATKALEKIL